MGHGSETYQGGRCCDVVLQRALQTVRCHHLCNPIRNLHLFLKATSPTKLGPGNRDLEIAQFTLSLTLLSSLIKKLNFDLKTITEEEQCAIILLLLQYLLILLSYKHYDHCLLLWCNLL